MKNKNDSTNPENGQVTSLKFFISAALADIDIFLLQNMNQTGDKKELFTVDQIRDQLKDTALKMNEVADKLNINNEVNLLGPFGSLPEEFLTKKKKKKLIKKYIRSLKKDPNRTLFNDLRGIDLLKDIEF